MEEWLYKRFICFNNFNEFFYVFGWRKGGGAAGAQMHVYVWEHIVRLYYRTAEWMFTKLGRDEMLMTLHMHLSWLQQQTEWIAMI